MSATPETDAAVRRSCGQWSYALKETSERLELERNDARKERDELNEQFQLVSISHLRAAEMCHDACKQRDMWKAAHDNQVQLRRTLMDRPDLKERAKSMQKLIEERDALKHALRLCLELVTEKDIAEENVMPELLPVIQAHNAKVKAAISAATAAIRVIWRDEHGTEFVPSMITVPMEGEAK